MAHRARRPWSTALVAAAAVSLPVGIAAGAHALWPGLPHAVLGLVFLLAAAASALGAARAAWPPAAPAPVGNLLARQLAVSAREEEVKRFQRFARDAPIGIVFVGRDGGIRLANDEYLRIVGRSREGFDVERFGPGAAERTRWLLEPAGGPRHETEVVRDDGTRVPVLVALSTQEDGVAAFIVDLSAEKALQREREEGEARLRALADRLSEADRRKDEFLGMLSHELRNPLAPIRNSVFLLRRAGTDPALRERSLGIVERQVEHLTRLVDDLLDVTRITRGRVELRRERVDLAALVVRTAEDHVALARARGVELSLDVPRGPAPVVDGDPTRLMQIVGNLLQNAVKFSEPGGRVTIALARGGESAELRVIDEGAGIEPALLGHVFEPFVQGERTLARSGGGLGLGLALVKALAELHGGTVAASSGGPGRGAEFRVSLPLAPPDETPERPPAPPRPAAEGAPQRARVLVVEDNREVAESLRDLVEAFGHEVHVARSGDAALAHARANPPDVVLCDIGLPGMTGYEVARAFRSDPALRHARLVAVTGYAQAEDRREAARAGFDRHVGKPPDPLELERLLA